VEKLTVLELDKAGHALFPIQILQAQAGDLAGPHPQAGGEQHHGKVAFPTRGPTINAGQNAEHLGGTQSPRRTSEAVVGRRAESRSPIALDVSQAEKEKQQTAQDFMNAVNAADVVGGLLADEAIQVLYLKLAPIAYLLCVEELIQAAHEQLNLDERVFGQALVLFREVEVLGYVREAIRPAYGRSQGERVVVESASGVSPAKEST
jgi:hypothetical protein